jgi:hypothetical protein
LALRSVTGRASLRRSVVTDAVSIAIVVIGLALRVHVADHDSLRAKSLAEFIGVFARSLALPFVRHALICGGR